jgi:hypothetical protein
MNKPIGRAKPKIRWEGEHRPPDPTQSLPRVVPHPTYRCEALRAVISEGACADNRKRSKGDTWLEDKCGPCPGVVALAREKR